MKRSKKHYIVLALVAAGLYGLYILLMLVLGLQLYVLLLTYLAIVLTFYLINRKNMWAVRGNYFYITGNYVQARRLLEKAVKANTKSPSAHIYYSLILLREDKKSAEALKLLERARAHCTSVMDERNLIIATATCLWLEGRRDEAVKTLDDMRTKHEYISAGALTTLGYMHFVMGNYDAAREATALAMEDDPTYGAAWDNMGQICYKTGDATGAKQNFIAALQKTENLADANYYLGMIYEAQGDETTAREHFRKAHICTIGLFNSITADDCLKKYKQYFGGDEQ